MILKDIKKSQSRFSILISHMNIYVLYFKLFLMTCQTGNRMSCKEGDSHGILKKEQIENVTWNERVI